MGYEQYKPKRTLYEGTWFDSNLEARVAEALDRLGIGWWSKDVCLRGGRFPYGQYTPDFRLSTGLLLEVAGVFDARHQGNALVACDLLGSTREHPTLVMVDNRGDSWGLWVDEDGDLRRRPFAWGGDGQANLFDAAGTKRR